MVEGLSDHGWSRYEWPTYVDLELVWGICWAVAMPNVPSAVFDRLSHQADRLVGASYGLWRQLHRIDDRFPEHVPLYRRLRLLHAYLLLGLDNKRPFRSRTEIVPSSGLDLTGPELAFVAAADEIRRLGPGRPLHFEALNVVASALKEVKPDEPW